MQLLPARALISVFKRTATEFGKDEVGDLAASLTYYAIFSIFPLLILLVTVASFFFDAEQARQNVLANISGIAPGSTAQVVADIVKSALEKRSAGATIFATLFGIVGLLFSASGVFSTLDKAINRAWGCEYKASLIKDKIISFVMVLGVALVMLASLVISAVLNAIETSSNAMVGAGGKSVLGWVFQILSFLVTIALSTAILIVIYRTLPRCKVHVRDVWFGALLTAVGWEIVKQGFAFYLGSFANNANVYGTFGAFFSLLTWIYLTGLLLLTGAEFTSEYGRELEALRTQQTRRAVRTTPAATAWRRDPALLAWQGDPAAQSDSAMTVAAAAAPPAGGEPARAFTQVIGLAALLSLGLGLAARTVRGLTNRT